MKENMISVVRNCFVIVFMAQIQYHVKHLITWRVWFRTLMCLSVLSIQLIQYMLFILTNMEISTMQCCLSLKCPKVHHNQMAQNLNGSSP